MPRLKAVYRCQECGHSSPKWVGQCPDCSAWNTLAEEVIEMATAAAAGGAKTTAGLTSFSSEVVRLAEATTVERPRVATNIGELDRLLGDGLVPGQVVLLAGPPGIGKSTLMLQVAAKLAKPAAKGQKGFKVLYISGEESLGQVSGRAKRLGIKSEEVYLLSETSLTKVLETMEQIQPDALILDSVQTVYHPDLSGSPGSVGQVRECSAAILRAAKSRDIVTFLLGHITKEGALAGPKVLEHIVDTVLYFDTESHQLLRVLRVEKNRFGPSAEIGLFEMGEKGLVDVADASAFFISGREGRPLPGRAVSVALEGSRPMLVEVQALVTPTRYPLPRRMATGLELNRMLVLIAALEKHLRLRLENYDVFLSLAGGMKQKDPAMDLAVCVALVSSARDIPLPPDQVFLGEVGLLGQISRVAFLPQRLKEAAKLGFKRAAVPQRSLKDLGKASGLVLEGFDSVSACAAGLPEPSARDDDDRYEKEAT
ncbi:MAG: DNA repair protein RadA [Elusimicrobia bacterium]|nr:DNA repair protein RadA [Elusimicrobiota bacterium]